MSVQEQLGLGESSDLLAQAREQWPAWVRKDSRLMVVGGFEELRPWLRKARPDEADEVLLGLAKLASTIGGDDLAAAATLAHALLPGAAALSARLLVLRATWASQWAAGECGSEHPDKLVAAQLWMEVRSFPWQRLRHVASNILIRTRVAVLREYGSRPQIERRDRTWAHTVVLESFAFGDAQREWNFTLHASAHEASMEKISTRALVVASGSAESSSAEELLYVLGWASDCGVITEQDRHLLLCMVEEAWTSHDAGVFSTAEVRQGSYGGFTSRKLTTRVAERVGLAEITVRRRTARSMRALAAASTRYAEYVA